MEERGHRNVGRKVWVGTIPGSHHWRSTKAGRTVKSFSGLELDTVKEKVLIERSKDEHAKTVLHCINLWILRTAT